MQLVAVIELSKVIQGSNTYINGPEVLLDGNSR